ncbi:enoyl-CoA hydratase-related protein [Variovorax ureilyticus]|uniref:Enoyl-CoA hydratase-related protein n=1 Tax=Variovorax ureilyticus TaxID=1836198 RepID=A0ABU8VPQ6_9BURK
MSVELDIADPVTEEAAALCQPDLVVAPFLKRRIPASVWQRWLCLVVHPGPPGDRGPSALDWAILEGRSEWGVTVLQATGDFDAGPIWAHETFALRAASKGSLYRREVADAAVNCTLRAIGTLVSKRDPASALTPNRPQGWKPIVRQTDRQIDWLRDTTARVLSKLRSADGQPGVEDALFGLPCRLYEGHPATPELLQALPGAAPGEVTARRDGAVLRHTVDGAVWIVQARNALACGDGPPFKLPCALAFADAVDALPSWPAALERDPAEWGEIRYWEVGPPQARVGCLSFDFHNGAMSTDQCRRLQKAVQHAKRRDTRVLLMLGGADFFSNGIHLHCIEAAAHRSTDSAADESWRNIQAMDDLALELITTTDRLTVSVLRGNAGAGGAFLALATDEIWAHRGVVLNPHYRNMGNLYGSEYWTYLLPKRLGAAAAARLIDSRLPIGAAAALQMGLLDRRFDAAGAAFEAQATTHALALAASDNLPARLAKKLNRRRADEAERPLADYRKHELSRMHRNFYGFDPSYHVARYHFVHKLPHSWTPRHLALHREAGLGGVARS